MNLTPVIFKKKKTFLLLNSLLSYHILVTALEINGLPPWLNNNIIISNIIINIELHDCLYLITAVNQRFTGWH